MTTDPRSEIAARERVWGDPRSPRPEPTPKRIRVEFVGEHVQSQPGDSSRGWPSAELAGPFDGEAGTCGW
jgi:hypothetical protein